MTRKIKKALFNAERGFTLLELLAAMAIVAVLAGIVTTSVSGTSESSRDAQAIQDSTTVVSAATDYFSDQDGAETLTPANPRVLNIAPNVIQNISSRWPENFVTSVYRDVFPPDASTTVTDIAFLDEDGAILTRAVDETGSLGDYSAVDILEGFTAIDFEVLIDQNYMSSVPDSVSRKNDLFSSYMWLFEKAGSAGSAGEDASRNVALFKLTVVQKLSTEGDQVALVYQRLN